MNLFILSEGKTPIRFSLKSEIFISLTIFSISKLEIPSDTFLITSFTN